MISRLLLLLLAAALAAGGYALHSGRVRIPDEWNPWAPLRLEEPLNWLTRYKLARQTLEPLQCLALLDQAAMRYDPLPDRETGPGCGFTNAVRVRATSAAVGEPFALSCRSAVALALWERHVLHPAAERHFGSRVTRLEHFGSYACRNVYNRKDAPLSRHATADALDIAGFVMQNGRRVRVARDWNEKGGGDADAAFLREVHDGACRVFDAVLGPEYNAAHRDHFHFDRGGWRVCR